VFRTEEDEVPGPNDAVRGHVLREVRGEINRLARIGMSAEDIGARLNGHGDLIQEEKELIELLAHHAVAEARGHF
jgi:hypothetical protein